MAFPTAGILDNFNRADGGLGANWTAMLGTITISSNQIMGAAGNNFYGWNVSTTGPDCEIYETMVTKPATGEAFTLLMRGTTLSLATVDGYTVSYTVAAGTDTVGIYRIDNAVSTLLGASINQELSNGDVVGGRIVGSTIYAFRGSTELGNRTDGTYSAAGYLEIVIQNTTARFDNFGGGLFYPSLTLTPTLAGTIGKVAAPTVVLGSVSVTPVVAGAVSKTAAPTVVLGSVSVTPVLASAIAGVTDPTVVIATSPITPTPASVIAGVGDPVVVLGSLVITPVSASVIAGAAGPTVSITGGLTYTPPVVTELPVRVEAWLCDTRGRRREYLDSIIQGTVTPVINDLGSFELLLPNTFDWGLLVKDAMVEFWYGAVGAPLRWLGTGKIRAWRWYYADGSPVVLIGGPLLNDQLDCPIIAYAAGTNQSTKTGPIDDMMKAIARENLGPLATDTARDLTTFGFSIDPDVSLGVSKTQSFAWKKVLPTLKELSDVSADTSRVYFGVDSVSSSGGTIGMRFWTSIGQPGQDLTQRGVMFSDELGNLANPELEVNAREEVTHVYSGGQEQGENRNIQEVLDTGREGESPWNRREDFADARNEPTTAGVTARGQALLEKGLEVTTFSGDLLDTPQAVFGRDWWVGDRVPVSFLGYEVSGVIPFAVLAINRDGVTVTAGIEDG